MAVEAKIGILRDRVTADGREYEVVRGRHGARVIVDPIHGDGRVSYDSWRDRMVIDSPHGSLAIRFRWRHTTFSWRGRIYHVVSSFGSRISIIDGDRPVFSGRIGWNGVWCEVIDPEFRDIARELAVGFGLRAHAFAIAKVPMLTTFPKG